MDPHIKEELLKLFMKGIYRHFLNNKQPDLLCNCRACSIAEISRIVGLSFATTQNLLRSVLKI